ncbi:MAG: HrcA family transcriptional regulator, partial [Peptococcaceae bacterium]|nr:HrcA family transcriptional regulator [Peptococcaceae bacterium]
SHRQQKQVLVEGALNVLSFEEFQDTKLLKTLLKAFSDEDEVAGFFRELPEEGIAVRIGEENTSSDIDDCGMVIASYAVGKNIGHLALIGPKRMDYGNCVAMLEAALGGLEQLFTRMEKNEARKNALSTVVAQNGDWSTGTELAIFHKKY